MYPQVEAGWGLGIKKGVLCVVSNAAPVVDDIGLVDDPPGGGVESASLVKTQTSQIVLLVKLALANMAVLVPADER